MSLIAAEVGVDRQLVAIQVVAGGLIFEVAERAGSVAGGDPRDVGEADRQVRLSVVSRLLGRRVGRRPVRSLTGGGRVRCIAGRPSV